MKKHIIIEKNEYNTLINLMKNTSYPDALNQKCLDILRNELKYAVIKEEEEMPDHVVRLNSMVDVVTDYGPKTNLQIVLPSERNVEQDKISIFSPMGSALIGYTKGDEVSWMFPKGAGKIKIVNVKNAPTKVKQTIK